VVRSFPIAIISSSKGSGASFYICYPKVPTIYSAYRFDRTA
jgi:hypothetical protein